MRESPWVVFSPVNHFKRFQSYRRTVAAVRSGENLYDWDHEKILKEGLMGPWTLNVYESFLAGAPAAISVLIVGSLSSEGVSQHGSSLRDYAYSFLSSFTVPLSLMLVASACAWASLREDHLTDETRERAKHAYLYFDGSHGLLPQMLAAFAVVGITLTTDIKDVSLLALPALYFIAAIWNLQIMTVRIPRLLFNVNGYVGNTSERTKGPWIKYIVTVLLGALLIAIAIQTVSAIAAGHDPFS